MSPGIDTTMDFTFFQAFGLFLIGFGLGFYVIGVYIDYKRTGNWRFW